MQLFQSHKVTEAIEAFKMAIATDPNEPDAYFGLGTILLGDVARSHDKEAMATAAKYFSEYLKLAPNGTFAEASRKSLEGIGFALGAAADETSSAQPVPARIRDTDARPLAPAEAPAEKPVDFHFPVAEKRFTSWCYGYLHVTPETVHLQIVKPKDCESKSFEVPRSEVHAERWTVLGQPQMGIELHAAGSTHILQWLLDPGEVESAPSFRLSPPRSLPPNQLLAAVRGLAFHRKHAKAQAPSSPPVEASADSAPASQASAAADGSTHRE
jgi:hypothetical protein